jgi:hypothetical protein
VPDRPDPSAIALLVRYRPPWAKDGGGDLAWCATTSELAALARGGGLRGAVIDGLLAELDPDVVGLVRAWCPVVIIDVASARHRWAALGATTRSRLPGGRAGLEEALTGPDEVPGARPPVPTGRRGALVGVLAAEGGNGPGAAVALAGSLVLAPGDPDVVLADLTLDAPHRALHGLSVDRVGVLELVRAARFGPPPPAAVSGALHPSTHGYRVLPGLVRHHDWIAVGEGAATRALAALRGEADVVVAHVDRDLEGETDTGSYDIEDRNVLARTVVGSADLVVVAAGTDRSARLALVAMLSTLAGRRVARERTLVVTPRSPSRRPVLHPAPGPGRLLRLRGDRADRRVGAAIVQHLRAAREAEGDGGDDGPSCPPPEDAPERIRPGSLGHWAQDDDGWITPRAPQQP